MGSVGRLGKLAALLALLIPAAPAFAQVQQACHRTKAPCCQPCSFWAGIYPTVLTPFCDCQVDTASLEKQIHFQLRNGVRGLCLLGTIGEGQYVTDAERAVVIATAVKVAGPKVPVIVGVHTCDMREAARQMVQARNLGAAGVLVKYLGNPKASPDQVLGFYSQLSDLHLLPIFYYHFPAQTKLKLKPPDIAAIVSLPGVAGIKESTMNLRDSQAIRKYLGCSDKVFWTATALNLTQYLSAGGSGAMCPEAVLMPGPVCIAYNDFVHGDVKGARAIQKELFVILPILTSRSTPIFLARTMEMTAQDHKIALPVTDSHPQARLKCALNCLGIPTSTEVKPCLPPLSRKDARHVSKAAKDIEDIDWLCVGSQIPPIPYRSPHTQGGFLLQPGPLFLEPEAGKNILPVLGDGKGGL